MVCLVLRVLSIATLLFHYSPFHVTTCFGLYRPSSGEIHSHLFKSYYAYNGSVFRLYSLVFHIITI
jgi:ABC-type cobalt transport system substrate-binding protein